MSRPLRPLLVSIKTSTGGFAEDKDLAARLREEKIRPTLVAGGRVTLDFTGVSLATQSFVHALISDVLRSEGEQALDRIAFKGAAAGVKGIVETVVQYSLESIEPEKTAQPPRTKPTK